SYSVITRLGKLPVWTRSKRSAMSKAVGRASSPQVWVGTARGHRVPYDAAEASEISFRFLVGRAPAGLAMGVFGCLSFHFMETKRAKVQLTRFPCLPGRARSPSYGSHPITTDCPQCDPFSTCTGD